MEKEIFKDISYGMYIVSSKGNKNVGCVINTLTQITSENPIISISLNKENYTSEIIKKTKRFAISIISEKTDKNIISKFGFSSSTNTDKFNQVNYQEIDGIPVVLENECGYLICKVLNIVDCQTHDLFVAEVINTKKTNQIDPMTYKYYHEVIKGHAPKKAPTYIEEKSTDKEEWICDICGYVHKGPLPDNFKCPVCGVDKSHFKKSTN